MEYRSIADIFAANERIRAGFDQTLASISPEEASARPDGEKWSIAEIAEHVSMVERGVVQICSRLLEGARQGGGKSDGSFALSPAFSEAMGGLAANKLEAPGIVHPSGMHDLASSMAQLRDTSEKLTAMRPDLETLDLSQHKFPHPYFGPLTAAEWLLMAGLHEERHRRQIEKVLQLVRE